MAKTILQTKCPFCGKMAKERSRILRPDKIKIKLECGHDILVSREKAEDIEIMSSDGRSPFPFQIKTVKFIEETDCNGLILHEQGLGKTVIECMLLRRNKHLLPALIVVKSGLRLQWMAEVFRWTGMMPQIITSSKDQPMFDMFRIIIVSIDTLRLLRPDIGAGLDLSEDELKGLPQSFQKVSRKKKAIWSDETISKFNHICIDESQKVKNSGSARTQALRKFVALAGGGDREKKKSHVVCMSGTNIEKHAGEFFVTLNLVRPELFPQETSFKLRHCEVDSYGKIHGLRHPEHFKDLTKDFIIRYRRAEVLPELPKVFRHFHLAEMPEGDVLQQYIKVVKDFMDYMNDIEKAKNPTDILGYLTTMRRLTGIAKVEAASEFIEDFLLENESDRKLTVFLHHKQAGALLMEHLNKLCIDGAYNPPLYLHAGLNMQERQNIVEKFKEPGNRIMVASTLAAGEGLNLQFCSDCMIMERQWNPSYEEQAEGRFPRPGSTADKINAHYVIAAGTIDDFLTTLIEEKRQNVKSTLDYESVTWDESSLMTELADTIMRKGLKRWSL